MAVVQEDAAVLRLVLVFLDDLLFGAKTCDYAVARAVKVELNKRLKECYK